MDPPKVAVRRYLLAQHRGFAYLLAAIAALVGAELVADHIDWVALVLVVVAAIGLIATVVDGNKVRYRVSTHPDQFKGMPFGIALMVIGIVGLAGIGTSTWLTLRNPAPPSSGVLSTLGKTTVVKDLRWGRERIALLSDYGWKRPSRDVGTCWAGADTGPDPDRNAQRRERVELLGVGESCTADHAYEVVRVLGVDPHADHPYPGQTAIAATAAKQCSAAFRSATRGHGTGWTLRFDIPRANGWARGDHEVSCVAYAPHVVSNGLLKGDS
jgi:heme/copper-type cytochrome/quinol oxidase subunit 2